MTEFARRDECTYSVPELSRAALNASVARVMPDERSGRNGYLKLQLVRNLAGNEDYYPNETIEFDAPGLPIESKLHTLVSESLIDGKRLIALYWRDPQGKTLQVYTCGLLPDNEQIEKDVIAGVGLGKGLREYE